MRALAKAAVIASVIWTTPSYAAIFLGERGGWSIYRGDESCSLTMDFEGPGSTSIVVSKFPDSSMGISVTNTEWTAVKGAEYDVSYVLDNVTFSGSKARGINNSGRRGFINFFKPTFEQHFTAGRSLHIYLGDQRIDNLSLSGTTAAMVLVNQCWGRLRATIAAAEREKARWVDLPKDPFAKAQGAIPAAAQPPIPRGNPGSWVTTDDYPPEALREQRVGVTNFRLVIDTEGRASACEITKTSGHADLDAAACEKLQRRARFKPATDGGGNYLIGEFSSSIRWFLPDD